MFQSRLLKEMKSFLLFKEIDVILLSVKNSEEYAYIIQVELFPHFQSSKHEGRMHHLYAVEGFRQFWRSRMLFQLNEFCSSRDVKHSEN